ncbi:hypothetical protein SERLA73DRAFT_51998 [Serpula lacrymans var. lacrymans S7.3]|uniref:RING-type domain-containing protein n=1 Tax=Serpula lacrymans var. lacrymans (strain S7.3) TaxID=936435 RepID=F8PVZ7_SERL3|nr:hypothetical protein SERLA73DRAFT_51998 [Serpula lacrymans var. lacrymans S7.3]
MTTYTYTDTPNSNLVCCICHAPFTDPTTTKTCSHTFCHHCILEAVKHSPQCPVDRSPLSLQSLLPANPIVKHLVDELIVQCPHQSVGCTHTCQRQLLASHLKNTCQHVPIPCSEPDCPQLSHNATCPSRTTTCPSCSTSLPRSQSSSHKSTCPSTPVACPHSPHGCPWTGPRHLLSPSHLPSCPYDAIKPFLALASTRSSHLADENAALRQRVANLEGVVQSMAREVRICKTVLGPWYHAEGMNSSPPSALPSGSGSASAAHQLDAFDAFYPSSTPTDPDPLSLYFPPPSEAPSPVPDPHSAAYAAARSFVGVGGDAGVGGHIGVPTHGHVQGRGPWHGQGHGHGYNANGHGYPHTQIQTHHAHPPTPVAPLNLNTTLEGTLSSLRESISALSASLDSLSRRNEIALTNEAMRTNEDVASLRYGMHGIRVQVHRIMMDRNAQVTGRMGELSLPPPPSSSFFFFGTTPPPPSLSPPVPFPSPAGTKL